MTNPADPALTASAAAQRENLVTATLYSGTAVAVDPWAPNPLVDGIERTLPEVFAAASSEAPAPTVFVSGDVPPFLASGVDPQVLMRLPYTLRHAAAAETEPARVLGLIEQYGDMEMAALPHPGLDEYKERVHRWASGFDKPAQTMSQEEADAMYAELFPEDTGAPPRVGYGAPLSFRRSSARNAD